MNTIKEKWGILGVFLTMLTISLFIFRSSGQLNIGWFWILSPFWFVLFGYITLKIVIFFFPLIRLYFKFKKKMKITIKEKWWEK